jgi:hypothetical protein
MLLNKHNLNIAKLASKEASRFTLSGIRITPTETVVTDGHCLMKVSTVAISSEEFPVCQGSGVTPQDDFKPFNLDAAQALKASAQLPKKSTIPVLGCAAVAVNGNPDRPALLTTDLEQFSTFKAMESGNYPDYERVIPKAENAPFAIGLDAKLIKAMMEQFIAFIDSKGSAGITLRFTDERTAVLMEAKSGEQTMLGVLMPMQIDAKPWRKAEPEPEPEELAEAA